jgi:hypothetical protein
VGEIENEVVVDETPAERLYAGNFKSPEDLEKAYEELRSMESRRNNEIHQLRQVAAEVEYLKQQIEAPRVEEQRRGVEQDLLEAIESGDPRSQLQVMAYLAQEAARSIVPQHTQADPTAVQLTAYAADQTLASRYGDYRDIAPDMASIIQQNPDIAAQIEGAPLEKVVTTLDRVYKLAKADRIIRSGSQVTADAMAAAKAAKEGAQTMQGSSAKVETLSPEQAAWDAIKNAKTSIWG